MNPIDKLLEKLEALPIENPEELLQLAHVGLFKVEAFVRKSEIQKEIVAEVKRARAKGWDELHDAQHGGDHFANLIAARCHKVAEEGKGAEKALVEIAALAFMGLERVRGQGTSAPGTPPA